MRTCTQCLETKSLDEFARDGRVKSGRRADCKACRRIYNRRHYEANREKRLAYASARHKANREKLVAEMRVYDAANRDAKLERLKVYREAHREEAAKRTRVWRAAHPETCRGYNQLKRARRLAAPSESIDPAAVYMRGKGLCGICGGVTDPGDWHLDHIVPLSKGGHHVYKNVQVSHPACNMSKGAKLLEGALA